MISTAASALLVAAQVLLPPPEMTVTEWAEAFRVLSSEDTAAPGRFSTADRPYQAGIMDACSTPRVQFVTVAGSSQWGKTQILNNIIGHRIHLNPGPLMVVHPTIAAAEKWSKTRFSPMVRDCAELQARVGEGRTSSNTITEKVFPGGILVAVGANAPAGLASQPIRDLFIDEVDRIPMDESAGEEGDFEDLAEARTADFEGRRLIFKCSTPLIKGRSRIGKAWEESDQRRWFICCPHCGHRQTLDFHQVVFQERETPVYACSGGGCEITEQELRRAVLAGEWIATRPHVTDHAGFHVHGLMVRPMATLVQRFQRALRKGRQALQVCINTQLGEWWDPRDGDELQVDGLMKRARAENYTSGQVPQGVGLLTAFVDVQTSNPQRLELLVVGWGSSREGWMIRHEIIPGNLAMAEPWDRLEALLLQDWGGQKVRACGLDTGGHFTKQVYAFCKRPDMRGLAHPTKGASRPQRKLVMRGKKARLWLVDTVTAKDLVLGGLAVETPGPGYMHLPNDLDQQFVEQLLSERPTTKAGRRAYEKRETDARNEALDLMVGNLAALEIFAPRDLDALVEKQTQQAAPAPAPPEPEPEPVAPARVAPWRVPRGGGMAGW